MLSFLNEDYAKVYFCAHVPRATHSRYLMWCSRNKNSHSRSTTVTLMRSGIKSTPPLHPRQPFLTSPHGRRILTYLIPLRILRGHLPTRALLDKFPVLDDLFAPFLAAIQKGDIAAYDKALEKEERRLVELNLLLTLERGRELCVRGLFRRVYVLACSVLLSRCDEILMSSGCWIYTGGSQRKSPSAYP